MSARKMHPPAMVQTPIGSIASKANTLVVVNNGGKGTNSRQNSENVVPARFQNGTAAEQVNSIKKLGNKAPPVVAATTTATPNVVPTNLSKTVQSNMNGASVISTLNSTNRRKSHRLHSPNRRRREQQNVFNNLRAWDVKIVSSVQPTAASQEGVSGKNENQCAAQGVGSSSSNEASKANSERSNSASRTTTFGSMSSSVSSNTSNSTCSISSSSSSYSVSDSINDNNGFSSKVKKRGVTVAATTTVPCKEPAPAVVATVAQNVKKKEEPSNDEKQSQHAPILQPVLTISAANGHGKVQGKRDESDSRPCTIHEGKQIQNAPVVQPVLSIGVANGHSRIHSKTDKKLLNGSGGFSANHRHPAAAILPSHSSSSGSVIPSSSSSSTVVASLPSTVSCVTRSSLTPPVMSSSSPAVLTSSPTNHSRHNSGVNPRPSNAGKVLLPNVNPLSGAPLDPMTLLQGKLRGTMIGPQQQPPHHISHHHSNHSNLPGQSHQQQQQQQHNGQPMAPTTSPHYSLDFLHSVGMRMFTAPGTSQTANAASSAAASALLRANPHFNYNNFNQQLHQQQQQLIHQHQQHQQQQQPFHQMQRHYSNMYNCDDVLLQTGGPGEPIYPSYPTSEHIMGGGAGAGTGGSNANENGMAYCYSQNHQHHHQQQHNHSTHQQQQHHHHHQQQSYGNGGSYHQNNNYQQHNRNYGRTGPGSGNLQNNGGKKSWNNNWQNGKKPIQGKYGNKGTGYNHGYRKNYNYYHNSHYGGGIGHHYDQNQNQQSESLRNLIYIKGYSNGQGAPESHGSISRSPTPSPQSSSPPIETTEASQTLVAGKIVLHDEPSDSGIEETSSIHKKSSTVPSSSSSSSSMVSIPSTDSSTISTSAAHNLSLEQHCGNGQGYESDSSHSSSYNSHTYRHRKYANSSQVYRSSSSTSSGVSSTATFPPLNPDYNNPSVPTMIASANNTPTAMNAQITDFFLRSQSYHGSHQNLTAVSASTSPHPPDSPVNTPRSIIGTQSMPMFSELFTGKQSQQEQHSHQQKQQRSQPSSHYGSNNSLEIAIPTSGECSGSASVSSNNSSIGSNCGSTGYASVLASTVPPNEAHSMQSGHPKKRYSGRSSPVSYIAPVNQKLNLPQASTQSSATVPSSQQLSPSSSDRKFQQPSVWEKPPTMSIEPTVSPTVPPSVSLPSFSPGFNGAFMYAYEGMHTPADRFLARAHLVELKEPPVELAPSGSEWASLSTAVWNKFASAQQTQQKFVQKINLWRCLFTNIRSAFPRLSLYMVGSSISGFASDSSDVDMCLVCRSNTVPFDMRGEALFQLGQLKNYFLNVCTTFEEFSVIQAKVPILRFRDTAHSIVIDLNFNNSVGIRNTHLLYLYSQMDWRLRPLALVVKLWAQHHNINDAKTMTISSYSLVLMVIHFLQYGVSPPVLPCLHALYPDKFVRMSDISTLDLMEKVEPYNSDNNSTLGELFVQFLEYYANFDYAHYAISVRTASVIPIESARVARSYKNDPHHWRQLCIEEPFDLTNTARSVFDADIFEQIKSVFSTCWRRLRETNDLNSIFECEPLFIPVASALSITS